MSVRAQAPEPSQHPGAGADRSGEVSSRRRSLPVVPLLLVGLLLVAGLLRPQQLLSTLTSPRALLFVLGVVLLTILLRRVGRRLPGPAATALTLAPAVVAFAVFLVPTLSGTTVDEELAGLSPMSAPPGADGSMSADAAAADGQAAPVRIATGVIEGIGHRGRGSASLVELPGGAQLIRLEDLEVDPGPDYRLYVVPGADQERPGGGVMLGQLKGTSGNQNYELPDAPPDRPFTVLVWCEAFAVPIAAATLT